VDETGDGGRGGVFASFSLWQQASQTGAQLLWRVRANYRLPVETALPDGSYLSTFYASTADQRRRTDGVRVRVVEYALEDHPKHETYRLMTPLLDHVQAPALELAALYPERREMEGVFDELKTHLRGGQQVVLRSKTPALVEQEIYGLLLAHRAVRTLMCRAAQGAQLDPNRLSFTHRVRVLRRKLARPPAFPLSAVGALAQQHPAGNPSGAIRGLPGPPHSPWTQTENVRLSAASPRRPRPRPAPSTRNFSFFS
jgi:hypothetical protein